VMPHFTHGSRQWILYPEEVSMIPGFMTRAGVVPARPGRRKARQLCSMPAAFGSA
jgi:hypothetical protein